VITWTWWGDGGKAPLKISRDSSPYLGVGQAPYQGAGG